MQNATISPDILELEPDFDDRHLTEDDMDIDDCELEFWSPV
jgi:hypothetical protein